MGSVAESKGPLLAAVKAIMIKAIADHGRGGAVELTGIGARTLNNWMRSWGFAPREEPDLPEDSLRELIDFLEIKTQVTQEIVRADCSLVHVVAMPSAVQGAIERATELLLVGNARSALMELLTIDLPNPVNQPLPKEKEMPCQ